MHKVCASCTLFLLQEFTLFSIDSRSCTTCVDSLKIVCSAGRTPSWGPLLQIYRTSRQPALTRSSPSCRPASLSFLDNYLLSPYSPFVTSLLPSLSLDTHRLLPAQHLFLLTVSYHLLPSLSVINSLFVINIFVMMSRWAISGARQRQRTQTRRPAAAMRCSASSCRGVTATASRSG